MLSGSSSSSSSHYHLSLSHHREVDLLTRMHLADVHLHVELPRAPVAAVVAGELGHLAALVTLMEQQVGFVLVRSAAAVADVLALAQRAAMLVMAIVNDTPLAVRVAHGVVGQWVLVHELWKPKSRKFWLVGGFVRHAIWLLRSWGNDEKRSKLTIMSKSDGERVFVCTTGYG